jgi:hypothetical protein
MYNIPKTEQCVSGRLISESDKNPGVIEDNPGQSLSLCPVPTDRSLPCHVTGVSGRCLALAPGLEAAVGWPPASGGSAAVRRVVSAARSADRRAECVLSPARRYATAPAAHFQSHGGGAAQGGHPLGALHGLQL